MKKKNSAKNGKIFVIILAVLIMSITAFASMTVQADSLKTASKKKITATIKKQYSKIKAYARKYNYTIARDKKEGKLVTSTDKKSCYKDWNIRLNNKKSKAFLALEFENTYSNDTKKVDVKIYVSIYKGKYKGTQIGHTEEVGSLTEVKQMLNMLHTESTFNQYIKGSKKLEKEAEKGSEAVAAGRVRVFRCLCNHKYFSTSQLSAYAHYLLSHGKLLQPYIDYVDAKWVR